MSGKNPVSLEQPSDLVKGSRAFTVAKLHFYQGLRQHRRRAQAAVLHVLEGAGFTSALTECWSVSH